MRVTYDPGADMAYIYFAEIEPGGVDESVVICSLSEGEQRERATWTREELLRNPDCAHGLPDDLVLDLDSSGRIVGIEVFGPRKALPEARLASAETVTGRVSYDPTSDEAYVALVEADDRIVVARSVLVKGASRETRQVRAAMSREELLDAPAFVEALHDDLVFDLDDRRRILGIKVFRAREQLPASLLATATPS